MFISKLKSFPKYDSFSKFISTRTQSFLNRTINMIAEIASSFPGCKITLNIAISYRFQASVCFGEIHLSVSCPKTTLFMYGWLWEEFLQNSHVHPQHSSELLVGGVVVKMHAACGIDLLLGAELRGSLD